MASSDSVTTTYEVVPTETSTQGRGDVGSGTPSSRLKGLFHTDGKGMSLKTFARKLGNDSEDAVAWFANKGGSLEDKAKAARLKLKGGKLIEIRQATKASRNKSKK